MKKTPFSSEIRGFCFFGREVPAGEVYRPPRERRERRFEELNIFVAFREKSRDPPHGLAAAAIAGMESTVR